MTEQIHVRFGHGLGDCANFAALATLYRRHGFNVVVSGDENKQFIWQAAGLVPTENAGEASEHLWLHPGSFWNIHDADCAGNKTGGNINGMPLPTIDAPISEMWRELCGIDLDAGPHIRPEIHDDTARFLDGLPGPIVALHAVGSNNPDAKKIDEKTQLEVQRSLVDAGYSVVVLDYDARAVQVGHDRIRGIKPAWGHISLDRLAALLARCALLIAVDSGPLNFARVFTRVPILGVYYNRACLLPHRVSLPSPRLTSLVPGSLNALWRDRQSLQVGWQFVDYQADAPSASEIVQAATAILSGTPLELSRPQDQAAIAGVYRYERVGHGEPRDLELRADGSIGTGAAERERRWVLRRAGDTLRLSIIDEYGVSTCDLMEESGAWRGHWNRYEKMSIVLTPKSVRPLAATPKSDTVPVATVPTERNGTSPLELMTPEEATALGLVRHRRFWIRQGMETEDLTVVQDIYECDAYRLALRRNDVLNANFIVDVGGHIGTFAALVHRSNAHAKIVCVEACPENITALRANVGHFAEIIHAACTYEKRPLVLLNAITSNGGNTGGSIVAIEGEEGTPDARYDIDKRPMRKVTLEEIMQSAGMDFIDILKLDCEGSEFSILENTTVLDRVKLIVGEYHGYQRWEQLRTTLFRDWDYGHMLGGELGLFHLENPRFKEGNRAA